MITFQGIKYELFFSNKLPPLLALNYSDEQFFSEFESLCGARYRILSIIREGWQEKYGRSEDITALKHVFEEKLTDSSWKEELRSQYETRKEELQILLKKISAKDYSSLPDADLVADMREVRTCSSRLDAMSNMLHLFSSLVGQQFFQRLHTYTKDNKELNENFVHFTNPQEEGTLLLSDEDRNFSELLKLGAYVKEDVRNLLEARMSTMRELFQEIGKRIQCSAEDVEYLQLDEILRLFPDSELIKHRRELTVLFYPKSSLEVREGATANTFLKDFKEIPVVSSSVLSGETASLGRAEGTVVLAMKSDDAMAMKEGDILVAPYTAVEYLPAMKKAAAIVTETGGITSHAAIVSRELGIPCVIGVRDVTKILSDGQHVIVDADKGEIRVENGS